MKTDKEYPATHSMDTAWFAVDKDGEVAIIQFEENGPVPVHETDYHTDELLTFFGTIEDGITYVGFSDEQTAWLMDQLTEPTVNIVSACCNVLLAEGGLETLQQYGAQFDLCYSKEKNFYHLDWWKSYGNKKFEEQIQKFIDDGIVLKAHRCNTEIYFEECNTDTSEHRLARFPFYVYEQDNSGLAERTVVPEYPLKEEQIPVTARNLTLRLPVRFSELTQLQPAEFLDCYTFLSFETQNVNGVEYLKLPLTEGGHGYIKILRHENKIDKNFVKAPRIIDKSEK